MNRQRRTPSIVSAACAALVASVALFSAPATAESTPTGFPQVESSSDFVLPKIFKEELQSVDTWRLALATRVCLDGEGTGRFSLTRAKQGASEAEVLEALNARGKTDTASKEFVAKTLQYHFQAFADRSGTGSIIEMYQPLDVKDRLSQVDIQRTLEQAFPGITASCPTTPLTVDTFRALHQAAEVSFREFDPVTGQAESLHDTPDEEAARLEFLKASLVTLTIRAPDSVIAFNNTKDGEPQRAVVWSWASPWSDGRSFSVGLVQEGKKWSVRATRKGTLPPPVMPQDRLDSSGVDEATSVLN